MSITSNYSQLERDIREKLGNWKDVLKKYQVPSNKKAILQLCNTFLPFLGLWVLMYFSLNWSYLLTGFLAIVNGFFMARIFIIQHDCGHHSFFKNKKLNNAVGMICSIYTSIPFKYWAKVHNHHHGHNGQLDGGDRAVGDIPYMTVKEYKYAPKTRKFGYRVLRSFLVMFLIAPMAYVTISNRFPFFNLKGWGNVRKAQLYNNILIIAIYTLLALVLGWQKFLIIHLSIILIFSVIAFWFFYVQHQHEENYKQWKGKWDFLVASIRGSTYYKLPKIFMWFTGSIGFHHIHHLNPMIPNYNLERCARENPIFQKYVNKMNFRQSLSTITNTLWDEESQRMVSFRQYRKLKPFR